MDDDLRKLPVKLPWKYTKKEWETMLGGLIILVSIIALIFVISFLSDRFGKLEVRCRTGITLNCDSIFVGSAVITDVADKQLFNGNTARAKRLYEYACNRRRFHIDYIRMLLRSNSLEDTTEACLSLSLVEESLGNYEKARKILNPLCDKGIEGSCDYLQRMTERRH